MTYDINKPISATNRPDVDWSRYIASDEGITSNVEWNKKKGAFEWDPWMGFGSRELQYDEQGMPYFAGSMVGAARQYIPEEYLSTAKGGSATKGINFAQKQKELKMANAPQQIDVDPNMLSDWGKIGYLLGGAIDRGFSGGSQTDKRDIDPSNKKNEENLNQNNKITPYHHNIINPVLNEENLKDKVVEDDEKSPLYHHNIINPVLNEESLRDKSIIKPVVEDDENLIAKAWGWLTGKNKGERYREEFEGLTLPKQSSFWRQSQYGAPGGLGFDAWKKKFPKEYGKLLNLYGTERTD